MKAPEEEIKCEELNDLLDGAFHLFDSSRKGYIESSELRQVLCVLKSCIQEELISEEDLEQMIQDAHLEQDRKVSFEGQF